MYVCQSFIEQHNTLVAFQSPKCNRIANIEVDHEYKFQLRELPNENRVCECVC